MNIRDAIYRAADRIEGEPRCYNFDGGFVPKAACGTTACMWGWIGFELGLKDDYPLGVCNGEVAIATGVSSTGHLYDFCRSFGGSHGYTTNAKKAARALRAYADKYHPAPKVERNFARELLASLPKARIPEEAT